MTDQSNSQTANQTLTRPYPPPGRGEPFWPAQATVVVAIALQLLLPTRLTIGPGWLMPLLETALLIGLIIVTPRQLRGEHHLGRWVTRGLTAIVSIANVTSLVLLSQFLLHNNSANGRELIFSGSLIWITNVLIFALWYWETDRGGPGKRAAGTDNAPDFLFPQMSDDSIHPADWRPRYIDYLYTSLTNATAFSPTDTMPLSPVAKTIMGMQSLISLVTIGLIVARAINILG